METSSWPGCDRWQGARLPITRQLLEARRHAVERVVAIAMALGTNALVMMRFDSSEIGQTMSEIVAYGMALVLEPD